MLKPKVSSTSMGGSWSVSGIPDQEKEEKKSLSWLGNASRFIHSRAVMFVCACICLQKTGFQPVQSSEIPAALCSTWTTLCVAHMLSCWRVRWNSSPAMGEKQEQIKINIKNYSVKGKDWFQWTFFTFLSIFCTSARCLLNCTYFISIL